MIFLEWRKGFLIGGPDETVSRGWIPYRLAIPTLLDENAFVKWIFKMIVLASFLKRKKGSDPFWGLFIFSRP